MEMKLESLLAMRMKSGFELDVDWEHCLETMSGIRMDLQSVWKKD